MNFRALIFLSFLIVACSSDKNGGRTSCLEKFRNQEIDDNSFQISLKLRIEKDDMLEVYFIEDPIVKAFQPDKKIRRKVLGSSNFQEVDFNLPKQIVPIKFRIDLGENIDQKKVDIDEIKLKYNKKTICIKDSLIQYFFVVNNFLTLKPKSGKFDIIEKQNKRDPFITSSPILNKKIKIEL